MRNDSRCNVKAGTTRLVPRASPVPDAWMAWFSHMLLFDSYDNGTSHGAHPADKSHDSVCHNDVTFLSLIHI